jgi:O-antigen/teichoic acid export membrane protein
MKRLFSNTIFTGVDAFALVALNLLATPILIKNFGVEGYGAFVFLSTFSVFGLLSFFDFGMEGSLMNYVARFEAAGDKRKMQDSLTVSILYYGAIGLALGLTLHFLTGVIAARFIDETGALNRVAVNASIGILSLNIFIQFLVLPFNAILQGLRRFVITKSLNTLLMAAQYVLVMVVAAHFHRFDYAFAVVLGLTVARLFALVYIVRYRLPYFRPMRFRVRMDLLKTLLSYSSILFVSRIIGIIFNQMDKYLIWLYLAISQMAIYDVVARPANLIRMLISILNSAIIPEVARLHHRQEIGKIRELYINLVRYAYLIILPILAVAYVHMDSLLSLWVGKEFAQYSYMVFVLLSVYLLAPLPSMATTVVVGLELVRKTIWISVVASIINMVLSIVLLKVMGLVGLLTATLIAEAFMVFPYVAMMKRILRFRVWDVLKPLLQTLAVAVPFVVANAGIKVSWADKPAVWLPVVAILVLGHYLINYQLLLHDKEKMYVLEKLRLRKTPALPGVISR